jgi:UDP-glucose 4-epimerase
MKRLWITGAHGFIGRYVAQAFARGGWSVFGIGHGSWREAEARSWGLEYWLEADITPGSLKTLCATAGTPDVIFHAAGGSSVAQSVTHPVRDFDRTVGTTSVLLDTIRRAAPEVLLVLPSSAAVYGIAGNGPIKESAALNPVSPYGLHKCLAEHLVRGAHQLGGFRYAIIRYFSIYGPGLRKQLLWDLAQKLSSKPKDVVLFGTGEETRDFLHVEDAARFAVTVADTMAGRDPLIVNGGSGDSVPVRDIAKTLGSLLSPQTEIRFNGTQRTGDPVHYQADTHLMRHLGFRPAWNLEKGVASYVDWLAHSDDEYKKCA